MFVDGLPVVRHRHDDLLPVSRNRAEILVRHALLIDLAAMRVRRHLVELLDPALPPAGRQVPEVDRAAQCPGVPSAAIRAISSIFAVVSRAILSQVASQAANKALTGTRSRSSPSFHRAR